MDELANGYPNAYHDGLTFYDDWEATGSHPSLDMSMRTIASAAVPVVCAVESAVENSCCRAAVEGNTATTPYAHRVWCCIAIQRNTALYILQLYSALHSTALYNPPQGRPLCGGGGASG